MSKKGKSFALLTQSIGVEMKVLADPCQTTCRDGASTGN